MKRGKKNHKSTNRDGKLLKLLKLKKDVSVGGPKQGVQERKGEDEFGGKGEGGHEKG